MLSDTSVLSRRGMKFAMLALCVALVGGCATAQDPPAGATATKMAHENTTPRAENCAIVTVGTPVKFACGGKVYSSWDLQHLREKEEQQASANN